MWQHPWGQWEGWRGGVCGSKPPPSAPGCPGTRPATGLSDAACVDAFPHHLKEKDTKCQILQLVKELTSFTSSAKFPPDAYTGCNFCDKEVYN